MRRILLLLKILGILILFLCLHKLVVIIFSLLTGVISTEDQALSMFLSPTIYTGNNVVYLLIPFLLTFIIIYTIFNSNKREKYRFREEYGSARWAKTEERDKLIDYRRRKPTNANIILSASEFLSMNTRKTNKNNNVLVTGGSGAGKTRYWVKPNLMQMHSSYVITDPKGELYESTKDMFENEGYVVKTFNLIETNLSHKYNPLKYIEMFGEDDIEIQIYKIVNNIMENTDKGGAKGEDFWMDAGRLLMAALMSYTIETASEREMTMNTVMALKRLIDVKEDEEDYVSELDELFLEYEETNPTSFAVKNYKSFKKAAGKTLKSIIITLNARLQELEIDRIAALLSKDEMELELVGLRKTVYYIIIPDATDKSLNFLVGMLYQQLFDINFKIADKLNGGALPEPLRFILDEFANVAKIQNFNRLIATMRSRNISVSIILQNIAQLNGMYDKLANEIIGNCDSKVFLGGQEETTLKFFVEQIGKETIDMKVKKNKGESSSKDSHSDRSVMGRDLISTDELGRLPDDTCLVLIRGEFPFKSKKYDLKKHKNYRQLVD